MNTHVTFVTDAFEMETPKENFINPCCFGEDCANWLQNRLKESGLEANEVFQEDWGWCFFVKINQYNFWIGIGLVDDEKTWMVFSESGLGRIKRWLGHTNSSEQQTLSVTIDEALKSSSHIKDIKWFTKENFTGSGDKWANSPT